ncbi:unnamed protein product [Vitrella brassicaformis CCMP3155]|uniref:Uncharacterized protein n=1 Tax=Vitrella brassicaformis (strain CCMP3155) TaxID=1169540 RepID=A0A0G4EBP8_VITBC|nr:unnamed protein product [Vitrella brassicaformis CCMP3155]|eukprot:CEL93065.1 unnamed protein product [Vitrella brassicaformis CCMP3155]
MEKLPAGSPSNGIQRSPISSEAIDKHLNEQQPSVPQDQAMQLIPIASPAADTSVVGGVPMQQQEGGSALMGGAGHGGGSGEGDITADAISDGSRQPSTAFGISVCAQQQQVANLTRSIDPSPVAAAAASVGRQPAGPSRPFPPSTLSPITPDQQHAAGSRQGQTSGSDAVAIMSLAADALLAHDIDPFVSHLEKLTTSLPDNDPAVKGLVGSLAKKDKAHRERGSLGLVSCIVAIFNDSSKPSHQSAAARFLKRLNEAGYPFGVEWLPLFGVLVEGTVGRLTLSDEVFGVDVVVILTSRLQAALFCHIDALVETLVTSTDQAAMLRASRLVGIICAHARRGSPSEPGVLASICRGVSASPAALGKIATMLKDHAACEWPDLIVLLCLNVPVAMAECGYCERVAHAGFLSAAVSILQSSRFANDASHGRYIYRSIVSKSIYLIDLLIDRETYASCEGLAELMCSLLSRAVRLGVSQPAAFASGGNDVRMMLGVLDSLARYWDRQVTSGKSKDNPIVERILQVNIHALSGPPTAASQDSLIQEVLDFFAKFRHRKLAIDRWASSYHDPQREAARQEKKQNCMVRCWVDKRVLHTIYQLPGPSHFAVAQVAMLAVSCRSLLDALCPVRSTGCISSCANRELLAPDASITVSKKNRLAAALARYSPDMMLGLSIHWEWSPTSDDISDLIGFLQRADRLMTLRLIGVDLTQLPDDECAQLADAIGRLPSLLGLFMLNANMSPAFADRLATLLKDQPEGDGKGSISESASPPPSSPSRDITRVPSTTSAAVPADPKEDRQETTEERQTADSGDDKKERPFTTLRRMTISLCRMSFNSCLNLLEGLCGRSFEALSLSNIALTKSEGEADRYYQLQRVLERLFGTIACEGICLSFRSVGKLTLPVVEDIVMSAATAGLKTNPNGRTLKFLDLPATANATESFLQFALKDLTPSYLTLRSRVALGNFFSQQFLSSGDFASLVHGAVTKGDDERESELQAARAVKERQWAADDARLPPAADAAEEDRRMAARQRREEGLQAKEKEARRKPPFVLSLSDVPFANVATRPVAANVASPRSPVAVINVIEATNKKYAYEQPVIFTHSKFVPDERYVGPSSRLPQHLCGVLASSYDALAPSTWWNTLASKAPLLLLLYVSSLFCYKRGPDSTFGFQNPFSVTAADLPKYHECVDELEALKDAPAINSITQEHVDTAHSDLAEAVRLVPRRDALQALNEMLKRFAVIAKLQATLQTKLNDLEAQRNKPAAADADIDSIDSQITSLTEQIGKNTAAKATLVEEIARLEKAVPEKLRKAMRDVLDESQGVSGCAESHQEDPHTSKGRQPTRFESKRDELRHKHDIMQQNAAREAEKNKKRGDQPPKDNAVAQERLKRAEARARAARKALGVDFSSDEDQPQHGVGGQQGGEGGKKAKKKKRHKNKTPSAAPAASACPLPSAAAATPSIASDGSPCVREGRGEADGDLELGHSEPSSSPLCGGAAGVSAASRPLLPSMAPSMPPLPDIGCDSDDLALMV